MSANLKNLKRLVRGLLDPQARGHLLRYLRIYRELSNGECPCCSYQGKFAPAGTDFRLGGLCPGCGSYERHRLLALAFQVGFISVAGKDVLHFGPYHVVRSLIDAQRPASHVTADINPDYAERLIDIEAMDLDDSCFDVAVVSHVLEHVDDRKALSELYRILRPGGKVIALVPLIEGWSQTYEDPSIAAPGDRAKHFGRYDHVRYYGSDFRRRVKDAGFELDEFTAGPVDSTRYRLLRGEKVFLARKPG